MITGEGRSLSRARWRLFAGSAVVIGLAGTMLSISGSGNSPNVVKAVEYANQAGAETLAVVGYDGGS